MRTSAVLLSIFLAGCTTAISSGDRSWWGTETRVTSCAEGCATWSEDGERCIEFRRGVTERCITQLTRRQR